MAVCLARPPALASWLTETGSLTARLRRHSDGTLVVKRLSQRWRAPLATEAKLLGLRPKQQALVREIVMGGHGQAWVYARSIFSRQLLAGRFGFLAKRGNAPLGDVLFGNRYITRGFLQAQHFPRDLLPASYRPQQPRDPWARIGTFYCDGQPLLVTEVFLVDFVPTFQATHP